MTNSKGWLISILGVLVAAGLWASLDWRQDSVTAAPLAQATATNTTTPTATRTVAPGDTFFHFNGAEAVPFRATNNGDGTYSLGVSGVSGGAATTPFPYGAGTQVPVVLTPSTPQPSLTPYSVGSGVTQPVQPNGAVAAQTPVAVAMAGQQVQAATTVVIPAQTPVAYSAGDIVTSSTPTTQTLAGVCRANGTSGYITAVKLATDQSTNTAAYRISFFQSPPPTLTLDNAANVVSFTNNAIRIGYVDVPAMTTGTGSNTAAISQVADVRLPYVCASNATGIEAVIQTSTAFTPNSAQQYYIAINAARD